VRLGGVAEDFECDYIWRMIRITEHIEFSDYTAYECPTCLEQGVLELGEKWQVCPSFHFTASASLFRTRMLENFTHGQITS
jgi:hypothetical protein